MQKRTCHADADANINSIADTNRIRTKNNMSPSPSVEDIIIAHPAASTEGPCPTICKSSRTPRHWKLPSTISQPNHPVRRQVMGRVGSLGRLPNPLTVHCATQPIKLRQRSIIHYHTSVPLPRITTPHPVQCYSTAGLVTNKAKTTNQIRPKRPRAETTQAETTKGRNDLWPRQSQAETTH